MRIALATSPGSSDISNDDPILARALEAMGAEVEIPHWAEGSVEWADFDVVAIRTTWDYHLHLGQFLEWTGRVSQSATLVNDLSLVRWNANKSYLLRLEERGVPVVPTFVGTSNREVELALSKLCCRSVVVKPEVGASALETEVHAIGDREAIAAHAARLSKSGKFMIQPFMEAVRTDGEISLVWIDGELTHAVRKLPGAGDFRVQVEHGGRNEVIPIPGEGVELARRCIAALDSIPLFARVDAVRDEDGVLRLMELELIEPELMFEWHPEAASKLAGALVQTKPG